MELFRAVDMHAVPRKSVLTVLKVINEVCGVTESVVMDGEEDGVMAVGVEDGVEVAEEEVVVMQEEVAVMEEEEEVAVVEGVVAVTVAAGAKYMLCIYQSMF